jgi:hypothetical protein
MGEREIDREMDRKWDLILEREMDRKWDLIPRQSGPTYERLRSALIDHPAELRLTESVSQALHVIVAELDKGR